MPQKKPIFKTLLSLVPAVYTQNFESIKTNGNIAFNGSINGTYNDNQMPGFNLYLKVDNAYFKYPDLPSAVNNIFIDLAIENKNGDPDNTIIHLKKFHAESANNPIDAQLLVSTPVSNAYLKGIIKGKLDLSQVSTFYPIPNTTLKGLTEIDVVYETTMKQVEQEKYDDINARGFIKISSLEYSTTDMSYSVSIPEMETEITPRYFDLKTLKLIIGQSDLNFKGKIENFMAYIFKDELLKGQFSLISNKLNVNTFLTSDESSTTSTTSIPDTSQLEAPSIPKNIDFVFDANIKQLLYDNMDVTNVMGKIILKNGTLDLDNLQFNALDGTFNMKAKYEYNNVLPTASFTFNMKNIDIKKNLRNIQYYKTNGSYSRALCWKNYRIARYTNQP